MPLSPQTARLLASLRYLSRFRACTASTKVLSERLGTSARTIARLLNVLEAESRIQRVTSPFSRTFKARRRTIYLVSTLSTEDGARRLVKEARANGKVTRRSVDVLCGWLGCTPAQLGAFVAEAEKHGWMEVERLEGAFRLTRTDSCPYFEERYWVEWQPTPELHLPAIKRSTLGDRVLAHFSSPLHGMDSNEQVADTIGSTPDSVRVTIGRLVKTHRLFSYRGHVSERCLSTRPPSDSVHSAIDSSRQAVQAALGELVPGEPALLTRCSVSDAAIPHLRQKQEGRDLEVPDADAVHLAIFRLIYEAGLGGVWESRLNCVQGLPKPETGETDLREAMKSRQEGSDAVAHCADFIFRTWRVDAHQDPRIPGLPVGRVALGQELAGVAVHG